MTNIILLRKLKFYSYIGVMPQENIIGAYFIVDIELTTCFRKAMTDDDLNGTVNYADVYNEVKEIMSGKHKLLEHAAYSISAALFRKFQEISNISITIIKENPPVGADCEGMGVSLEISREEAG